MVENISAFDVLFSLGCGLLTGGVFRLIAGKPAHWVAVFYGFMVGLAMLVVLSLA